MKSQVRLFFTALMFYTRIPCPKNISYSQEHLNQATRYFPLIGWIVGGLSFLSFYVSSLLFDIHLAVLFSLISGVLLTGAFHEDGFADVFDGFGGGWTKDKILEIMKDSRIGVYGTIALIFLFLCKFSTLDHIASLLNGKDMTMIALLFITYHALARLTAIQIVFSSQYSRDDASSKAKPIAKSHSYKEVIGAYIFGLIPFAVLCLYHWKFIFIILPLILLFLYSKNYFEKWIDGYTGDCLGAVEQFAECFILLSFVVIWKFM